MAYARTYEEYEVRDLLRSAEGVASPVTGAPAHSRGLHAASLHGGEGITKTALSARADTMGMSNSQRAALGIKTVGASSMFPNLIMQSAAATQALNSGTGQAALAVFDSTAANLPLRMTLTVSGVKESSFIDAAKAPSVTYVTKGNAPVPQTAVTTGVKLIIDRDAGAGTIFIQTCIPLNTPGVGSSWEVKNHAANTVIGNG
jgi:hypothetical protein